MFWLVAHDYKVANYRSLDVSLKAITPRKDLTGGRRSEEPFRRGTKVRLWDAVPESEVMSNCLIVEVIMRQMPVIVPAS